MLFPWKPAKTFAMVQRKETAFKKKKKRKKKTVFKMSITEYENEFEASIWTALCLKLFKDLDGWTANSHF